MSTQWMIQGRGNTNCTCAYGCPCQFNALPTHGSCHAVVTVDGRVANGIVSRETSDEIVLRTTDLSEVRVRRDSIDEMQQSQTSIMPQGMETRLSVQELQDLLAYLQSLR